MAEKIKRGSIIALRILVILLNIALIVTTVLFTVIYSRNVRDKQQKEKLNTFCNNVDSMRHISEQYLDAELATAESWKAYIENQHLTLDEALRYIRTVEDKSTGEAHIIDMETFDAFSTYDVDGDNYVGVYRKNHEYAMDKPESDPIILWLNAMEKMYNGEKSVLAKYRIYETNRNVIGVGTRLTVRMADGADRDYLLMRVILLSRMRELWVFPTTFPTAEVGMITINANYVVPSPAMKSENFMEFVRYYNFADDYYGADELLEQLREQKSGILTLHNSEKSRRLCYFYYSRLNGYDNADILGYIPVDDLSANVENLSLVLAVAGMVLLLGLIDVFYIFIMNRKLKITAHEAERANRSKTQFLSTMSHDIRTPLNAVLGMTELAQSHIDDMEYVKNCLGKITVSGNHLLTLINDVLEISRVESGRINITPAPFDVPMLISGLESITRSQAVGHGLTLVVKTGDMPYQTLIGDRLRLTQVYLNLLNNAVKYTKPGGSVELKLWEEGSEDGKLILAARISDTGIGMTPEFRKTMYDAFTRVVDSRTDKIQGTGLGLSIVKRMVDLMDGSIECESAIDVGTTFTVRVPLEASTEPVGQDGDRRDAPAGDLRGISLLVAEDNDINWEIVSAMLADYGIITTRAENGRECVEALQSSAPGTYALVLMDVQMPVLNGLDATREIRASARLDLRDLPIVAMTADAFAEDVQNCIEAGMNAHVAKPIEIDKVLSAIRRLLTHGK